MAEGPSRDRSTTSESETTQRFIVLSKVQVTLATGLLCFVNPYTRMSGTELVYNLFAECIPGSGNNHEGLCVTNPAQQALPVISAIGTAMLVKGALTIVTFGIKVPAGIFIPSLGGTSIGRPPFAIADIDLACPCSGRMCRADYGYSDSVVATLKPEQSHVPLL